MNLTVPDLIGEILWDPILAFKVKNSYNIFTPKRCIFLTLKMKILLGLIILFLLEINPTVSKPYCQKVSLLSINCDSIPPLNSGILNFVKTKINKKVGRGECTDLASEALKAVGAKYDGRYVFGRKVDYKKECVYPGDIIQFEGVKTEYQEGNMTIQEAMLHHTAVINKVNAPGNFELAHQNFNNRKKVITSNLDLKNIKKGKIYIYRPIIAD